MQLAYFSYQPNFGDSLNGQLWDSLVPGIREAHPSVDFYGIGSIIGTPVLREERPGLIFGCGVRRVPATLSPRHRVWFVRGPISARSLDLPPSTAITDPAYLARDLLLPEEVASPSARRPLFIPHYYSSATCEWRRLFEPLGVDVFLPEEAPIEGLLKISRASQVITEAMHGAILADALRTPWLRVRISAHQLESRFTAELKWQDWLQSVGLEDHAVDFEPVRFGTGGVVARSLSDYLLRHRIENFVKQLGSLPWQLSRDATLQSHLARLHGQVDRLRTFVREPLPTDFVA